jgi:galactose oxidase-like protein/glyoxal oxidase-like protein
MPIRPASLVPGRCLRPVSIAASVRILLAVLMALAPASDAWAVYGASGRWSGTREMGAGATHLALLPGDASRHSYLLFWHQLNTQANPDTLLGAVWGWDPSTDTTCCNPVDTVGFFHVPVEDQYEPPYDLFCAGHSALADGRLLVTGGHIEENIGERKTTVFDPVTKRWQSPAVLMDEGRWYPSNVILPDSRTVVFGGSRYESFLTYGGRIDNGASRDTLLHRLFTDDTLRWQPRAVIARDPADPANGRPAVRHGHTLIPNGTDPAILFGGRDSLGNPKDDTWRLRAAFTDVGEAYKWEKVILGSGNTPPAPRSLHSAVIDSMGGSFGNMLIFGGLDGSNTVKNDLWKLSRTFPPVWSNIDDASGPTPAARQGHAAIRDGLRNRMIVFGGVDASGNPVDNAIWRYNVSANAWDTMAVTGSRPSGRQGHTFVYSSVPFNRGSTGAARRVILYGGKDASQYRNDLWELWLDDSNPDSIVWNPVTSMALTARAFHSAVYDDIGQQMVVFGGEKGSSSWTDSTWTLSHLDSLTPGPWTPQPRNPNGSRFLHQSIKGPTIFSRIPERYTPSGTSGTWAKLDSAYKWVGFYPFTFVLPSGNVFFAGAGLDTTTFILDQPASSTVANVRWKTTTWPSRGAQGSAVMYRPGEVLKTGGGNRKSPSTISERIHFNASDQSALGWRLTDPMHFSRMEHNLTALPDGKVIVTGGRDSPGQADADFVKTPEIFNPVDSTWTGWNTLESATMKRGYHSTAVLLPDGRIMSAGGELLPDVNRAQFYCPPYLFKTGTNWRAARPEIQLGPDSMYWGKRFTIKVPDTLNITSACLIRPGSATHAFDQNQRYVPLTIQGRAASPMRLFVDAPSDSMVAPPGYYMLFLTGSADRTDVPSIARWVRFSKPGGPDRADEVKPGNSFALAPDFVGQTTAYLNWYATADDTTLAASGKAKQFHLRASTNPINTEAGWDGVGDLSDVPSPGPVGTFHGYDVTGLQSCTLHYFALRADDDNANLSVLHAEVIGETTCGPGGGFSARPADETAAARGPIAAGRAARVATTGGSTSAAPAEATDLERGTGVLIAETQRVPNGDWKICLRSVSEAEGLDPTAGIAVQVRSAGGGWNTLRQVQPDPAESPLGLCALRQDGRIVVSNAYSLDQVVPSLRLGSQYFALFDADHSRLGEMGSTFVTDGGPVDLAEGDSLQLTYRAAADTLPGAAGWYVLVRSTGGAGPASRRSVGLLPSRFALHQNQPNPFLGTTVIPFDLPKASAMKLEIFDLLGRRVATVVDGTYPAGSHTVEWDLRDGTGSRVRPGVYIYRMVSGDFRERRKMTVLAR